jgi:hypothetical protein
MLTVIRMLLGRVGVAVLLIGGTQNVCGQQQVATIREPVHATAIERSRERWVILYDNDGYDMDGDRVDANSPVTLYNPRTMEELSLTLEHLPLDPVSDLADTYWDVNTGGIYSVTIHGEWPAFVELHVESGFAGMAMRDATEEIIQTSYVQLEWSSSPHGGYRLFASENLGCGRWPPIVSFTVFAAADNTQVWHGTSRDSNLGYALYWIDDRWLWPRRGLTGTHIFNIETGEQRSFAPDVVVGYGSGAIVTISPDSRTLRVRNPSGELIYEEDRIDLRQLYPTAYSPGILLAYYDDPYVYLILKDMGGPANTGISCCIINTKTSHQAITVGANSEFLGVYYPDSPGFAGGDRAE